MNMLDECRDGSKTPSDVMKSLEGKKWNATGTYWHWSEPNRPYPLWIWELKN